MPPSSNWLRPYTYNVVALDVSKMLVQIQPEVPFLIAPVAQLDRAMVF